MIADEQPGVTRRDLRETRAVRMHKRPHRCERDDSERQDDERAAGEDSASLPFPHVRNAQTKRRRTRTQPAHIRLIDIAALLPNLLELLLKLPHDNADDDYRERKHNERNQDNHRCRRDLEGRMHLTQEEEDQQEDAERAQNLPVNIRETEDETLHEIGERHQQRKIEHHAVDDIVARLLHIRVGARFVAPRRPRQFQRLLIIVLQQLRFRASQVLVGKLVQLVQPVTGDTEPLIETRAVFIKPPHIANHNVRREANLPVFPHDEPFARVKRRVFHPALCRFDKEQPFPNLPIRHPHFDTRFRLAVNERDRLRCRDTLLLPRFRHPKLFRRTIRERIVDLQFAQSAQIPLIYQIIDSCRHTREGDDAAPPPARINRYLIRKQLRTVIPQIRRIDDVTRIRIEDIGLHLLHAAQSARSPAFHRQPRHLKVALVITHHEQIPPHTHHRFVLATQRQNRIRDRFIRQCRLARVKLNHIPEKIAIEIPHPRRRGHLRIAQRLDKQRCQRFCLLMQVAVLAQIDAVDGVKRRIR